MDGNELTYAVNDKPPIVKLILLGLQHTLLMSVYLVLIIIVVRASKLPDQIALDAVRVGMIALAIATSLQALKPPIGSGFLAAPVVSAIYFKASLLAADVGGLPLVLGMTMFAGFLEILFSRLLYHLRVIFPPGISGFIIVIVGIELGLEGIRQFLGVAKSATHHFEIDFFVGLFTLAMMVGLSIWWRGIIKLICSFIGLVSGFIVAFLFGAIEPQKIALLKTIPYVALPNFSFISYQFSFDLILPFFIASIAAALRTIGVVTTCQKINDPDWKSPDLETIKSGVFADGMGSVVAGLLGIPGISTGPSLVGISSASGATSRYIAFATSCILVIIALFPKIVSILLIIPMSVIGPALMFTASFMIVGGVQVMTSRNIDARMTYVIGFAFLFGLSKEIYPTFYESLPHSLQSITSTSLSLSVFVALFLHMIFRLGIRKDAVITFEKEKELSKDELNYFILENGKKWSVNTTIMDRVALTTGEVMQHLRRTQLAEGDVDVKLSYNQVDFVVHIKYVGDLLLLPFVNQGKKVFLEEEAFSYGLTDFLTGVYPDKFERFMINNEAHIKLYFIV
ncbi:Xanthine permease XanQ [Legionella steigerwaltii]|uniref:Xanthine permease XanQ n=1 Tax=Legionella steigerwaltii TaxID=460 RepID=A0A378L907_9GAMM|nr:solute carrier family 23 protein [Legionella steigerwaltii]KTD77510.1 Xanthine permease XanQ [Legionella steigerwaltii]STY22820.1 Xanthine permease XanQ [Legionella steigerwaltii]